MSNKMQSLIVENGNGHPNKKGNGLETLKTLMDQASEGMVVIDAHNRILHANAAAELILHQPQKDLLGRPFPHRVSGEGRSVLKFSHNGDGEKQAFVRVTKIVWGNQPAYLVTMKDASGDSASQSLQHELHERQRLDGLKDELIASVSHEIRSPLCVIQAAVESLQRGLGGPLTGDQAHLVRMADRSTGRLLRLTENLLELSRLESGRMAIKMKKVDAARLIREVADGLRLVSGAAGAAIIEEVPRGLPPLNTDPNLLIELLHNLIENGLRFAKTRVLVRAVVPSFEAAASEPVPPRLHLSVIDDGPGIAHERIESLFDKNVQLSHSRVEGQYRGSGLGLSICQKLVEALKGRLWVESICGEGAQFHVLLPCDAPETNDRNGGHHE
jgi:signal transduction histidine kinase